MSATWTIGLDELEDGHARLVDIDHTPVCVVRVGDDVHAIGDICTHQDISLAEGEVDGCTIECWKHGSAFDLRTGIPETLPATRAVPVYTVRIHDRTVEVTIP